MKSLVKVHMLKTFAKTENFCDYSGVGLVWKTIEQFGIMLELLGKTLIN
jgi:hypothetical protein